MIPLLAEVPYPRINPDVFSIGPVTVRWYGVSYVLAFAFGYLVLRYLARRGRWPVEPDKVADVLFWGILGVFFGGRIGWVLFYGLPSGSIRSFLQVFKVWEGGMSFHGGLAGVVIAYLIYTRARKVRLGEFFDGLALGTTPGIFSVRMANFVNAELYGRPWDGPWAMRFPTYRAMGGPDAWQARFDAGETVDMFTRLRHPSQLYEALFEGLFMFIFLWWLMMKKGVGGGRIAATFLVGYGLIRFLIEFVRKPDEDMGFVLFGAITQGQVLSLLTMLAGFIVFGFIAVKSRRTAAR